MAALFTGEQLAAWAEDALAQGARYWYGTCWYRATEDLLKRKKKQYPAHYTSSRMARYRAHVAEKRMVCDCVGLIKGFFWTANGACAQKYASNGCPDTSANGMYALCSRTGNMDSLPEVRGAVLWKKGHIGVYVGNGMAVEARGFDYGVVRTRVSGRGWSRWGLLPGSMISYSDVPDAPDTVLKKGMRGAEVRRMQKLLIKWDAKALPKYGTDGDFGSETRKWVKKFQKAAGMEQTGVVSAVVWARLREV